MDAELQGVFLETLKLALLGVGEQVLSYGVNVSWDVYSLRAAELAKAYRYDLIKDLSDSTRTMLGQELGTWIESSEGMDGLVKRVRRVMPATPQTGLRDRGRLVAETETTRIYADSRLAGMQAAGLKQPRWTAAADELVCPVCRALAKADHGKGAIGSVETKLFLNPDNGEYYPMPAHPGCVLPGQVVAVPGLVAAAKSFYRGVVIEIHTRGGRRLSVTENHPVLTTAGWKAAYLIREGDQVVAHRIPERVASSINPYYDHRPTKVEQVFSALKVAPFVTTISVPVSAEDLHGDGRGVEGDIEIVGTDWLLLNDRKAEFGQPPCQVVLDGRDVATMQISGNGLLGALFDRGLSTEAGLMSPLSASLSLLRSHLLSAQNVCLRHSTPLYAGISKNAGDGKAIDAIEFGKLQFGEATLVPGDDLALRQSELIVDTRGSDDCDARLVQDEFYGGASNTVVGGDARQGSARFVSDYDVRGIGRKGPGTRRGNNIGIMQNAPDRTIRNTVAPTDFLDRSAGMIEGDDVIGIERREFSDHVYDLQSYPYELYICNGIVVKNCRCWARENTDELMALAVAGAGTGETPNLNQLIQDAMGL